MKKLIVIVLLAVVGGGLIVDSGYIYAKAELAQEFIEDAWQETLEKAKAGIEDKVKPWSWADTWPVARMQMAKHDIDLYVLNGTTGNALAFGPGYMNGSSQPGYPGAMVIGGHRDTHFSFLKDVKIGEQFSMQTKTGEVFNYRIISMDIVDVTRDKLVVDGFDDSLVKLVTCYPFDAVNPGGPQRYVVTAGLGL
ncbi:MAG: class GN sortase [Gammaproteobacteria bacterium]|nr:MAG: class GN sortase [Gammaproteobacteria bacterium]